MAQEQVRTAGASEAQGGTIVTRVSTPVYNDVMQRMMQSISLADDVVESAQVEYGTDGKVRAWVKARTAEGDVSEAFEVPVPPSIVDGMREMLTAHRDDVRLALKVGITKTAMAALVLPPSE